MTVVKTEGGSKRTGGFACTTDARAAQKLDYKSPIDKIEDAMFTCGLPTDTATFEESTDLIARHISRKLPGRVLLPKGIRDGVLPVVSVAAKPVKVVGVDADTYELECLVWKEEAKAAIAEIMQVVEGNKKLFGLFLDQCVKPFWMKLKGTKGFDAAEADQDGIALHGFIRAVMCGVEEHLQDTWVMAKADKALHTF